MNEPQQSSRRVKPTMILIVVGVLLVFVLVVMGVRHLLASKAKKPDRVVQTVQVIRPPPPQDTPPPPPPPDTRVDTPIPQDAPEPSPADSGPSEQLGLDAEGSAGGDAFGLAARKGGQSITGGGGAIFAWYTQILKDAMVDRLGQEKALRAKAFAVVVRVWVATDGQVQRAQLVGTSGSKETDAAIEGALTHLGRLKQAPPLEMPQPVTLKINSRI
jgi:protein TonB